MLAKIVKRTLVGLIILILAIVIYALVAFPPIMTGMAAKTMCSCVFVMQRSPESVIAKELTVFPGLASTEITFGSDSSVTSRFLGRTATAVYRKGLGCTLVAKSPAAEIRAQPILLAPNPGLDQDTIPWPAGDLKNNPLPTDIDVNRIADAVEGAFIEKDPDNPAHTHAVVVVYNGQIVGEKYAPGFSKDSRLMGWSMTKSITNALVGILVRQGKLHVDAPAPVDEWKNDERNSITLNNLLQASSGLDWNETYFLPGDFHSMFIHSDDKGAFAASKNLEKKPGDVFKYSSGTTNILSRIVRKTVGDSAYYRFVYEELFYKIGMNHALLEPDASGTFVGSSYGFASARDWARFGLLYLNDGVWMGNRILPEGWVKYSSTPAAAAPKREYGAQWWLNQGVSSNPADCKYPGLPADAMVADGFEDQFVVVIPSRNLVIVRLGVTHNNNFDLAELVDGVVKAVQ